MDRAFGRHPGWGWNILNGFLICRQFGDMVKNTLTISVYSLIAGFPIPLLFALIMNSITRDRYKRIVQTVTYAPHFISTVVIIGMLNVFLAPSTGIVNQVIKMMGGEPQFFMGNPDLFADMYVWSGVWQNMGYSSIIYLGGLDRSKSGTA